MRVSAKADYAIRAMVELAAAGDGPLSRRERIAQAQGIPIKFLENIMVDLRNAGLVRSQRGMEGGYWLARPAAEITLADVIRAVDGPLANVRGRALGGGLVRRARPSRCASVWIAVRASLRRVLESVTLGDVVAPRAARSSVALARTPSPTPGSRTSSCTGPTRVERNRLIGPGGTATCRAILEGTRCATCQRHTRTNLDLLDRVSCARTRRSRAS